MLSAAEGATLDVTVEVALWARVAHIYPIGLLSLCLGLGLATSRLGPGFAPVGEARHARACGPLRLAWPQTLQGWKGRRLPRGGPCPTRGRGPSFFLPLPLFFEILSCLYTMGSPFHFHPRPTSTYTSLTVNQMPKTKSTPKDDLTNYLFWKLL